MKAAHYAEALYEASTGADEATQDRLIANLVSILEEQGHRKLLPSILREYEHLITRRSVRERAVLRVAQSSDREQLAEAISRDAERIGVDPARCATHVDESVVGGYSVEANGKRIDRTHKRALLELYTKLVTTA